jgi:hypothetical protein
MKIKIGRKLKQNCINNLIPIILSSIILCGQSYAQWERTNLPDTVKVNTIVIKDSSIFAGTNGDGIFVSTNNGEDWKSINEGLQSKVVHTILITGKTMPAGQARIFAGTETGVSVSTDNGENWRSIDSGLSGLGVWSLAVNVDTAGDTTIFAGSWSGVYSSTDRGENWKVTGLSNTTMPVHSVVIFRDRIFAATLGEGIFWSQDNGLTWRNISITYEGPDFPDMSAAICSISIFVGPYFNYVVAGSSFGDFYYTDYRDAYFLDAFLGAYWLEKQAVAILCFANRNDTLFSANSAGYFFNSYYSNFELTCKPLNIPYLGYLAVYSLALNNAYIFAGTEGGIWRLSYPGAITRVEGSNDVPAGFVLEQNHPNPFNPTTVITYRLPVVSNISLIVYDVLGRPVAILANERQTAGSHSVRFDAGDLPSGVYFYSLAANGSRITKKLILMR